MNDTDKSFEAEMRSFRPQPPSPALKQQIADSLSRGPQAAGIPTPLFPRGRGIGSEGATRSRRPIVAIGLFTIATAACIALAILLPRMQNPEQIVEQPSTASAPTQQLAAAFDDTLPSLWSYRQALLQSSAAAEALLDQHSAQRTVQPSEDKPDRARVYLFARFPSELDPLPGEL